MRGRLAGTLALGLIVLSLAAALSTPGAPGAAAGTAAVPPQSASDAFSSAPGGRLLVAYGDSFTKAWEPGLGDQPAKSWATGSDDGVLSVLERLHQREPSAEGFNAARSGALMGELPAQILDSPTDARWVLLMLGINDACRGVPASEFAAHADAGFDFLRDRHPDARVLVYAIPDLVSLGKLHRGQVPSTVVRTVLPYCYPYLAPSPTPAEEAAGAARLRELNRILESAAQDHGFQFYRATYDLRFESDELSVDYFHPNAGGEAKLAHTAWTGLAARPTPGLQLALASKL